MSNLWFKDKVYEEMLEYDKETAIHNLLKDCLCLKEDLDKYKKEILFWQNSWLDNFVANCEEDPAFLEYFKPQIEELLNLLESKSE